MTAMNAMNVPEALTTTLAKLAARFERYADAAKRGAIGDEDNWVQGRESAYRRCAKDVRDIGALRASLGEAQTEAAAFAGWRWTVHFADGSRVVNGVLYGPGCAPQPEPQQVQQGERAKVRPAAFHTIEPEPCRGCGAPLIVENAWMNDGCPCNTPAGVNDANLYRWKLLSDLQQKQSRELAALRAGAKVPEGWRLVPMEPSDEMQRAGWNAYLGDMKGGLERFAITYRAMLAAAPSAKGEG